MACVDAVVLSGWQAFFIVAPLLPLLGKGVPHDEILYHFHMRVASTSNLTSSHMVCHDTFDVTSLVLLELTLSHPATTAITCKLVRAACLPDRT